MPLTALCPFLLSRSRRFSLRLQDHRELDTPDRAHLEGDGVKIKPYQVELEEDGVRISLNLYDTPGFGDAVSPLSPGLFY